MTVCTPPDANGSTTTVPTSPDTAPPTSIASVPSDITGDPLAAFVSRLAVELGERPTPSWTSVEGSMLSADISGFTALSEKLAGKGQAGAEEITELLNRCFTELMGAAYEYGGEVLKFGGDAILVLFRGDSHARRAVDGGLEMQRALHASSAAKRASLTMTVGVAEGPFDVFLVGSGYRELVVTGPQATEVIRLEGEAEKGETLISESLVRELPPEMIGRRESGGVVVSGSTGDARSGVIPRVPNADDYTPFVPGAVREQLSAFAGLGGEHRLVTVGFVMVTGVEEMLADHGPRVTAEALHEFVDALVAACDAFGVTALHTDIAPDGVKFVLCAGAPLTPGNTCDAMLHAALRIAALDSPFVVRQGVQTGRVFAGFLGTAIRRAYTSMGDPVNTAARMLGKAGDRDVVAVESVVSGARTLFVTEPIEPFLVKGKSAPITAHRIRAATGQARQDSSATSLIGRRVELDTLTSAIESSGETVILEGAAGVGKSRLLEAFLRSADRRTTFRASCTPYGAASPYSVFRPILRAGAGIGHDADPIAVGRRLNALVTLRAPHLRPMLPLLALPFGATVASTPEADAIDPTFRRQRVHDVVTEFLDATLDGPVLLVAEDLHWADDASADLVNHLVRAAVARPWSAVLTRRDEGAWEPPTKNVRRILLEPLTNSNIRLLAIESAERSLSDADLDQIVVRAAGNPLFAIELARARSRDERGVLPDSIEQLIAARIDDLPPDDRRVVRIAAVFGREFEHGHVAAVGGGDITIDPGLDDMIEAISDEQFRFRHAMHRDVAYAGLPFRERRRLHGHVASRLETTTDQPDLLAPVLSLHYSEAGQPKQAWKYGLLAGSQAADHFAQREAADAYRRALDAARHLRSVSRGERRDTAVRLGDALLALGEYDEAFRTYRRARQWADGVDTVDLMRRQAVVRDLQGALPVAARWLDRCLDALPEHDATQREQEAHVDVDLAYAAVRHRQGRFEDCLVLAERAAAAARQLDDRQRLARALDRLHVAATYLGRPEADEYGPEALGLHRDLDDHLSEARILDNMGIQAYFACDWDRAVDMYDEAARAGAIAGDVIEANLGRANAAEVWSDRGRFDLAETVFTEVLRNWSAAGWTFGVVATRANLALVRARRGDADATTTVEELARCLSEFEALGAEEFVTESRVRIVEALSHIGDHAGAEAALGRLGAELSDETTARIERQRALIHLAVGDLVAADRSAGLSLSAARSAGARYQVGLSALLLGHLRSDDESVAEGRQILGELGIVELPAGLRSAGASLHASIPTFS
ncbi:AAA family ATPase [Ilumatobacter nonamiensis]|uniref:AAA family ATPase n=1 Tax=Ilumatobacter nonamiensis TaxID=467093 RepID=UPI00034BB8AF|nr:adenylate/guanylate cyclase domain-containing protein [Ilumatobacter nonamiensis]